MPHIPGLHGHHQEGLKRGGGRGLHLIRWIAMVGWHWVANQVGSRCIQATPPPRTFGSEESYRFCVPERERCHLQVIITSKKKKSVFDSKMPSRETPMPAHLIAEEDVSKDKKICLKL